MKLLNRNKRSFTYKTLLGTVECVDSNNQYTGEKRTVYSTPVTMTGNVGIAHGTAGVTYFGTYTNYDISIYLEPTTSINESTIITYNGDEYNVTKVGQSLTHTIVACKKKDKSTASGIYTATEIYMTREEYEALETYGNNIYYVTDD